MTPLKSPVHRETGARIRDAGKTRAVIVSLLPGDVIQFRLKGTRTSYVLPIDAEFYRAARLHAERLRAEKRAARKGQR